MRAIFALRSWLFLALFCLTAGCQASKENPERDRLLAQLPQPFTVARTPSSPMVTLSAANTAKLLAALKDSRPVHWERNSMIEYVIVPIQPEHGPDLPPGVFIMEGTVFKLYSSAESTNGTYYQSDQNLAQLIADSIKTDAPRTLPQPALPNP